MKNIYLLIILTSVLCFFWSCEDNRFDVDISDVKVDMKFTRFDKALFEASGDSICMHIPELTEEYGDFFDLFNHRIISVGGPEDRAYCQYLQVFINTFSEVYLSSKDEFSDLSNEEEEISNAFRYYKYYFPDRQIPRLVSHFSGFNQSVVISDSLISISLDKYLGSESEYYNRLGLPEYLKFKFDRRFIPIDAVYGWLSSEFPFNEQKNGSLAANMIYEGKMLYMLDAMFPFSEDSLKIGYSSKEIQWCERNEKKMWSMLIEEKKLFSTEYKEIKRYMDNAPFTATFTSDSPGRSGAWIGWQIVRSYMNAHPEVNLQQLMDDDDYQKLLNNSEYHP